MSKPRVIVTRRWHPEVEQLLVERYDTRLNEDDHPMSLDQVIVRQVAADETSTTGDENIHLLLITPLVTSSLSSLGYRVPALRITKGK